MKLILASSSPRRAEILRDAGLSFEVIPPQVEETPQPGEAPEALVRRLAEAKAWSSATQATGAAIVLGADTEVVAEGAVLGKPAGAAEARRMLRRLSGRTHQVVTGVVLVRVPDGVLRAAVEVTQVTFAPLSAEEIRSYVASGEPLGKAGAYGIQGIGGRYVTRVEGCYFNVVGLPLARVYALLRELGGL